MGPDSSSADEPACRQATLDLDIPSSWRSSVDAIKRRGWRKILVLGATDRGKSTYCQYLSQRLQAAGDRVAFVDADVGQKHVGAPAAITLGYPTVGQPLSMVQPTAWSFVGTVSPVGNFLSVVLGTQKLVTQAQGQRVIINTTGFIQGLGRELKGYKIEALQPDVIVSLARGQELQALLAPYAHMRTLKVSPSPQARRKTPAQRRANRERAFRDYFHVAQDVEVPRCQLTIQRSLLFSGTPMPGAAYAYAERTSEGIVAVGKPEAHVPADVTLLPVGFERSLLCGVTDLRQRGLGLAILTHIDFKTTTFYLRTPVPVQQIRCLQFGQLYLNSEGQELGRVVTRH